MTFPDDDAEIGTLTLGQSSGDYDLSTFHGRFATAIKGESPHAFSKRSGISSTMVRKYLEGAMPGLDMLLKIAEFTGVTLDWLAQNKGPMRLGQGQLVPSAGQQVLLPRYDIRASAGSGALVVSENVEEHFAVGRDWLRRNLPPWAPLNAKVGVLENGGDSMWPTIQDGDLLMVVQDVEWRIVERGGIFVFTLDDRLLLKRLQVLDNGDLRIISDNKIYEPLTVPRRDIPNRLILHGQVFFAGGKPRNYPA